VNDIRLIDVKKEILADNRNLAAEIRRYLRENGVFMVNLMASPGAGKTSVIIETARRMSGKRGLTAVIEGDIESVVDSEKIAAEGLAVVQLRTGGICHLDAAMISAAIDTMDLRNIDLVIVENIGNLICPAEFDIGENLKVMILSVPEGDDKVLKYPLMFSVCDALAINKTDYLALSDFNVELLKERVRKLNPNAAVFEISCRTGEGMDVWCDWLSEQLNSYLT
jgi:hydrogenase nickel incorporation protein HypB